MPEIISLMLFYFVTASLIIYLALAATICLITWALLRNKRLILIDDQTPIQLEEDDE